MNILRSLKPYQRWQPGATILGLDGTYVQLNKTQTGQGRKTGVRIVSGNSLTAKIAKKFRRGRKEKS